MSATLLHLLPALFLLHHAAAQDGPLLNPFTDSALTSSSIQTDIQCYSLPYGGIGFLSHMLTYETLLCLTFSHSPWLPWKHLKHWKLDAALGCISLLSAGTVSLFAVIRCRFAWPFILLILWKMSLSVALAGAMLHRAYKVREEREKGLLVARASRSSGWIAVVVYGIGLPIGLVGLAKILTKSWATRSKDMEIITGAFAAAVIGVALVGAVVACCTHAADGAGCYAVFYAIGAVGVLAALYSDWILAAIEVQGGGNWWGYPSGDVAAVYWTYFVAKRLPLFSL